MKTLYFSDNGCYCLNNISRHEYLALSTFLSYLRENAKGIDLHASQYASIAPCVLDKEDFFYLANIIRSLNNPVFV